MECRASVLKTLVLTRLAVLMTGASVLVLTMPLWNRASALDAFVTTVVGLAGVTLSGLGTLFYVRQCLGDYAVLINEDGIQTRRDGIGLVPWDAVEALWIGGLHGTRFLCIQLADPDGFLAHRRPLARALSRVNRAMGYGHLNISFQGLSPGLREAWQYMETLEAARDRMLG